MKKDPSRHESHLVGVLVRDAPGVVFHDGPRGVGAELEAAAVVEFLHGPHERDVGVRLQLVQVLADLQVLGGRVVHQAQIALDQQVAAGLDLFGQRFDLVEIGGADAGRVETVFQLVELVLQEVHLAE